MTADPVLLAQANIDVPLEFARSWFLGLAEHPERYKFETHAGFTFTDGKFGEPGAHFESEETFAGVATLRLQFELTDVSERRFTFRLLKPVRHVWGYFELEPVDEETTKLELGIGSDRGLQRTMLQLPPVRGATRHQIQGEVDHIAASMNALYQSQQEG